MKDTNQTPYATTIRKIGEIFNEMGQKAWTLIPQEEMKNYKVAYDAIEQLLKKTSIPFNIDDK